MTSFRQLKCSTRWREMELPLPNLPKKPPITSPLPTPPPLLSVRLVFNSKSVFDAMLLDAVTTFLDSAVEMEFSRACSFSSVALLERIWNGSYPETEPSPADSGPGHGGEWSRRRYLRTDRLDKRFQSRRGILTVCQMESEHKMEVIKWLFDHFHGCIVPFGAVASIAEKGELEILKFFREHEIPEKLDGDMDSRDEIEASWEMSSDGEDTTWPALC
ncbi:unnamed protein product [Phytophthora lilii]|uniref:Unnamed protein product n=1 Tax=Phytophthora lilii TaxID=2077276 RepID=A0A9W6TZY7_9STRA|nr:unnamed protein product [Phytophthora lilii]